MSSIQVSDTKTSPATGLRESLVDTTSVLQITSLDASAGQPARLNNLSQANVVSNVNRSAQNAVANQQAHSQLTLSVLGQAVSSVGNLGPLEARSSVDVLSNNEVAQAIADLKAAAQSFPGSISGGGGHSLTLWQLIKRIILAVNRRIEGDGTLAHPFKILDGGPIYSQAPVTFAFPGVPAGQATFTTTQQAVNVIPPRI